MSVRWQTRSAPLMGTDVTVTGGATDLPDGAVAEILDRALATAGALADAWTRFDPASPLERLNADPRPDVEVAPVLGVAVRLAVDARARSGGLVDPTLGAAMCTAGYDDTIAALERVTPRAVAEHAAGVPCIPARPARRPAPVRVDRGDRRIRRAPGVRLDLGGIGKGLAADLLAPSLAGLDRWTVDAGGDVLAGGTRDDIPQVVHVSHPLDGTIMESFDILAGAVATSAVTARAWRGADGSPAHHLLDPSTGRPAWTGLLQATAVAASATDAERLAKEALLRGPRAARALLAHHGGGALVDAHGTVERIGGRT